MSSRRGAAYGNAKGLVVVCVVYILFFYYLFFGGNHRRKNLNNSKFKAPEMETQVDLELVFGIGIASVMHSAYETVQ